MSTNVKKYHALINKYEKLPKDLKIVLQRNPPQSFIKAVCEICLNIYKLNVPVNTSQKRKLLRYKKFIRKLCCGKTKTKTKKKIIQKGGSFLPLIFSVAAPIISSLLSKAF